MEQTEEQRIGRLLASVEREELQEFRVERATGAFARNLFGEEGDSDGSADDEFDEPEPLADEVPELPANDLDDNIGDENLIFQNEEDFCDLESLPLSIRMADSIVPRRNNKMAYVSKDRSMLWDVDPQLQNVRIRRRNIILMRMGHVSQSARAAKTPYDVWNLFFTDDIIQECTECTNVWLDKNRANFSRARDCISTTPQEIKCVLGLLYMAGTYKAARLNLEDLWEPNGGGIEFFRLCMGLKRFKLLLRALRFDDIRTRDIRKQTDKLAPIRSIFEQFVQKCKENYVPSEFVTIDEMLASFRGRCSFRQYIKNKPAKYGIKIFSMVCAKSFYTSNLEVYAGKQPEGPFRVENSGKNIVERLVQPISGTRRNVTVDNWFCSIPLCKDLLENNQLTLVGTLRKNKKEIPPIFIDTKDKAPGAVTFGFKNDFTLVSYVPKKSKVVVLLSSMHYDASVDSDADSNTYGKPEIILFYNSSKGGVDTVDKYISHYSAARTTNRWSMVVFYALLNVGGLNSFIVFKKNTGNEVMKRRVFLRELSRELCKEQMLSRLDILSIPTQVKRRLREILHVEDQPERGPAEDGATSGRCFSCDRKKNRLSKTRCATCKNFICREHTSPAVCVRCKEREGVESDSQ